MPFAYTPAQARAEAVRCLSCKNEPCVTGCPVGVDVPAFLKLVAEGDFRGAIRKIKETNLLPAICGRVCPQESQCQENCMVAKVHKDLGFAVSVGKIEAFLADWEREEGGVELPSVGAPTGLRVAIIGAGPSGLTCAGDLRRFGHEAVVFEAFHKAGGVLVYGIPEFRLPKAIVAGRGGQPREDGGRASSSTPSSVRRFPSTTSSTRGSTRSTWRPARAFPTSSTSPART